jgi:hypothetical protein
MGTTIGGTVDKRISKGFMASLQRHEASTLTSIQQQHRGIKSLKMTTVTPEHKFYAGEGYVFDLVYESRTLRVDLTTPKMWRYTNSHFLAPHGTTVFVTSYWGGRYHLEMFIVRDLAQGPYFGNNHKELSS